MIDDQRLANIADLALHPATPENEWIAAATAFFRILRNRNAESDHLSINAPQPAAKPQPRARPYGRRMPFGKYKDRYLSDIPTDYLEFLVSCDWLRDNLRSLVEAELDSR